MNNFEGYRVKTLWQEIDGRDDAIHSADDELATYLNDDWQVMSECVIAPHDSVPVRVIRLQRYESTIPF